MSSRRLLWSGVGVVGTVGAIGGAWMLSLRPARGFASPPPIEKPETEALLAALKPPKRQRPVIASIGINDATETTDYLVADAWSRTYRSRAVTFAPNIATRESRNGIQIVPDQVRSNWPAMTRLPAIDGTPAKALDETLQAIGGRYGADTTDFVAMQLEYPTESHRAVRERANALGQTAMTRSLR